MLRVQSMHVQGKWNAHCFIFYTLWTSFVKIIVVHYETSLCKLMWVGLMFFCAWLSAGIGFGCYKSLINMEGYDLSNARGLKIVGCMGGGVNVWYRVCKLEERYGFKISAMWDVRAGKVWFWFCKYLNID